MKKHSHKIHSFLTEGRQKEEDDSLDPKGLAKTPPLLPKSYERMPRVHLPTPIVLDVSLQKAINDRRSVTTNTEEPLLIEELSTLLHTLSCNDDGFRGYPSGGAKYPIETYLVVQNVTGLSNGIYHYNPKEHVLEDMWKLPEEIKIFPRFNGWANNARATIVFTSLWHKSEDKYGRASYLLSLLECGHAAQNILLTASALNLPACPIVGTRDNYLADLLDLNTELEQPVYAIALG